VVLGKLVSKMCILPVAKTCLENHRLLLNTVIDIGIFTPISILSGFMLVQDNGLSKHTGI